MKKKNSLEFKNSIKLKDLSFSYYDENNNVKEIIKNINIEIKKK